MRLSIDFLINHPISNIIMGSNKDFTFRQRFLLFACFFIGLNMYLSAIGNVFLGFDFFILYINLICAFLVTILYFLIRILKITRIIPLVLIIITNTVLSSNWFYCNGMNGSIPIMLLTFFSLVFFLFEGRFRVLLFCIFILNVFTLHFIEYYHPEWVVAYSSQSQALLDHLISFVMSIPLIAIAIIYAQKLYINEKQSNIDLIEQYRNSSQYLRQQANDQLVALSIREREVFQQIIEGRSNKEIADKLNVEIGTIKTHINNIYKKLDVKSRSEISKYQGVKTAG